jgi:hypothetical protein
LECYVYVAAGKKGVKVGVSASPYARARTLGVKIHCIVEVVHAAALDVEGLALTMLGQYNDTRGEWVLASAEEAEAAVMAARDRVSRYRHADPRLTAEEARLQRIRLNGG